MIPEFLIITWMVASIILLQGEATPTNPQNSEECDSPACQQAVRYLLDSIDPSVDPCHDFYRYSCGGWFAKNPIPKDRESYSAFTALEDEVKVAVAEMLTNAVNEVTHPRPIYEAANLFLGCLDEDAREAQGLNPLRNVFNSFGGWPMISSTWSASGYQWQMQVAKLNRMLGTSPVIAMKISTPSNHTSQHTLYLAEPGFGLEKSHLVNMTTSNRSQEVVAAYRNFIISAAKLLNPNIEEAQVSNDADEIIEFESALARLSLIKDKGTAESQDDRRMTIAEVQNRTENTYFEWTDFFNEVLKGLPQVTDETEILLYGREYLKNALKLANETNPRILANYIGLNVIFTLGSYATKQFRQTIFQFGKVLNGVEKEPDLEKTCMQITLRYLEHAVERLYVDKYLPAEKKRNIEKMIEDVRAAYRVTIMDSTWMDTETRNNALEKLDAIKVRIGTSAWITNDTQLTKYYSEFPPVEIDEFFSSIVQILGVAMQRHFRKWNQPVDPNPEWPSSTEVNAFFYPEKNVMVFPAGILNPPFYGYDSSPALNFGAIGATIGHEIAHAFDDYGSQFDKDGNRVNWWSNETKEEFNRRADCFKNQYSSIVEPMTNKSLNADQTLGEDISDNGAIRNAFFAFKFYELKAGENEWMQHKKLPGITATPDQLYFLGYGTTSCDIERKEAMELVLQYDSHSPDEFRVLIPLSNSKEFAEAFNCPVGSPMNPASKCVLW